MSTDSQEKTLIGYATEGLCTILSNANLIGLFRESAGCRTLAEKSRSSRYARRGVCVCLIAALDVGLLPSLLPSME